MTATEQHALRILGISPDTHTYSQGYNRYRYLAKKHHPDKGGDTDQFKVVQNAWEIVKPLLPKELLPIAQFHYDTEDNLYLRFVEFSVGGTVFWVNYRKEGDHYVCCDEVLDDWMPASEKNVSDKTHRIQHLPAGYDAEDVIPFVVHEV